MSNELARASQKDVEAIYRMGQRVASHTYWPMHRYDVEEAIEKDFVYLIMSEGSMVGFLVYKKEDPHILLDEFVVQPSAQGRGIGTFALSAVLKEVEGMGVELITHPQNPALRLYERHGFLKHEVLPNYYGDGEPRVHMIRARVSST